ncbi:MAG: hypothetical protein JO257_13335 [Deltaproteobacteria bacterium]|nr:hypothetical protein [Deltaproteobacteria bacterium]
MKRFLLILAACGGAGAPVAPAAKAPGPGSAPYVPPVDVAWDQLTGSITEVKVVTADATLTPKVQGVMAPVVGKPLDRTAVREAASKVFGLPGVKDVLVRGVQRQAGIELELELTLQPTVHAITASPGVTLPGQVVAANGLPLDPVLLDSLARELREKYLANGYVDAQVRWSTKPVGSQVDVSIDVTPGTAIVVDKVDFKGNAHAKSDELAKAIVADVAKGTPWNGDRVEHAELALTGYYFDHGYVNVQVVPPAPSTSVVFEIKEGDQFRVGKLSIKDAKPADEKKLLAALGVKKGDIFSRTAMTTGMKKLQDATKATDITPVTHVDAAKKTIDVEFEIPDQKSVSPSSK